MDNSQAPSTYAVTKASYIEVKMISGQDKEGKTIVADPLDPAHDRNAFRFGFTPQAEIWNGRLAMIGFIAYLLWDLAGYSVVRDVLNIVAGSGFPR
ncbi:high light inducible protein [Gloeobacter kilaueensis JS1]|uniref:High light inducible protein n=2 Tax=Gloeobacter TaxID=33071 RepID=U5QJI9_GLOK1|nr:chlorophyll a/b-binding protein [Gloeobacter kilaueensis]AGY59048.1 high light inducible protein [Gloeobacter kilaueensis JS1]